MKDLDITVLINRKFITKKLIKNFIILYKIIDYKMIYDTIKKVNLWRKFYLLYVLF